MRRGCAPKKRCGEDAFSGVYQKVLSQGLGAASSANLGRSERGTALLRFFQKKEGVYLRAKVKCLSRTRAIVFV